MAYLLAILALVGCREDTPDALADIANQVQPPTTSQSADPEPAEKTSDIECICDCCEPPATGWDLMDITDRIASTEAWPSVYKMVNYDIGDLFKKESAPTCFDLPTDSPKQPKRYNLMKGTMLGCYDGIESVRLFFSLRRLC